MSYLQTKIMTKDKDPDQKWITTHLDYLHRIKHFFRWMHNEHGQQQTPVSIDLWKNPEFVGLLKSGKTKRITPYSESEIWEKHEFLSISYHLTPSLYTFAEVLNRIPWTWLMGFA
jgi:hypothetical protein